MGWGINFCDLKRTRTHMHTDVHISMDIRLHTPKISLQHTQMGWGRGSERDKEIWISDTPPLLSPCTRIIDMCCHTRLPYLKLIHLLRLTLLSDCLYLYPYMKSITRHEHTHTHTLCSLNVFKTPFLVCLMDCIIMTALCMVTEKSEEPPTPERQLVCCLCFILPRVLLWKSRLRFQGSRKKVRKHSSWKRHYFN